MPRIQPPRGPEREKAEQSQSKGTTRAASAGRQAQSAQHGTATSESPRVAGALPGGPGPGAPSHQADQTAVLAPAGARAPSPLLLARPNPRRGRRSVSSLSSYNHLPPPSPRPLVERVVPPPRALRLRPLVSRKPKTTKKIRNPQIREIYQYRASYQSDC